MKQDGAETMSEHDNEPSITVEGSIRKAGSTMGATHASSDADQELSEADRAFSDADQALSDRDSASAVSDQRASDDDQAVVDGIHATQGHLTDAQEAAYARSREARDEASRHRRLRRYQRSGTSMERDSVANERDQAARERRDAR
jgi:hypothetical protein